MQTTKPVGITWLLATLGQRTLVPAGAFDGNGDFSVTIPKGAMQLQFVTDR